ncbi:MAG: APC family permease [bacterium]
MDIKTLKHKIFGKPKDVNDPHIFHKMALIPALAWIGLGADGLSSSSYGPEEAFRVIVNHPYIAVALVAATALTVFIISYAYSRIIEYFPSGGGGYVVATQTLGKEAGVISGSALIVDYILTITVSIASCGDALFSFLPMHLHHYKLTFEIFLILILIVLNIRGIKESVRFLAPIFVIFVITHIVLIGYGIYSHSSEIGAVTREVKTGFNNGLATLGGVGMLMLFLRAYSMGGGTYTGIEAVSNGLQIMKDPKVKTGKRTMVYMSVSLAVTAGGLLLCYLLFHIRPTDGKTMNALLAESLFSRWHWGYQLALITIISEGALLFVAAQTGFIDGPRVMANMALDGWFPRRFSALSDRFTMKNGVMLMGVAALAVLVYTKGSIGLLVVMYSINVFLTFSLSELGMSRFFIKHRKTDPHWKNHLPVHLTGLILCSTILLVTSYEKVGEGGWVTLLVTSLVILICYLIRSHYKRVGIAIHKLDSTIHSFTPHSDQYNSNKLNPNEVTAIQLVSGFNSLGIHTMLSVLSSFPWLYKNFIFVGISVVDSASFKDKEELDKHNEKIKESLQQYVEYARKLGIASEYRYHISTDVVDASCRICIDTFKEFPHSTVFAGKLLFQKEEIYHRILHNDTSFSIQKNLLQYGIPTLIMPVIIKIE